MAGSTCTDGNLVGGAPVEHARMHQALFYAGEAEYLDGVMGFIEPALAAGQPIAAALPPERGELLRRELNGSAPEVEILDMYELGRNPARIIPAVEATLARHEGALLHYIGEPIWPGRSEEEVREATRHEALVNLAWPGAPIRLLCPYDAVALDPYVLADARRTHPTVMEARAASPSTDYDRAAIPRGADQALPSAPEDALELPFGLTELGEVRELVLEHALAAGLSKLRADDLRLAISELASNAIKHGFGTGTLRVWSQPDELVCQVEDDGHINDPLAGRRVPEPGVAGGLGLWMVNQLCDLVEVRSTEDGTTARLHTTVA